MDGFHEHDYEVVATQSLMRQGQAVVLERRHVVVPSYLRELYANCKGSSRELQLAKQIAYLESQVDYLVLTSEKAEPTYLFYVDSDAQRETSVSDGMPAAHLAADWEQLLAQSDTPLDMLRWRLLVHNDIGRTPSGDVRMY